MSNKICDFVLKTSLVLTYSDIKVIRRQQGTLRAPLAKLYSLKWVIQSQGQYLPYGFLNDLDLLPRPF